MHLQEINGGETPDIIDEYFLNIRNNLSNIVPEFKTDYNDDEHYMVLFEFGSFLIENFQTSYLLEKCITFLDEAIIRGTSITEEAIALQVFYQLFDKEDMLSSIRKLIANETRIVLDYYHFQFQKSFPSNNSK